MSEGRVVEIRMPVSIEVHIFASEEHPGCDIVLLSAKCIDVTDGQIGGFMSRTRVKTGDCSQHDLLDHVVDWLRHEVAEQLGMDPHKNDVRDQLARDVQASRDRNADEIDAMHERLKTQDEEIARLKRERDATTGGSLLSRAADEDTSKRLAAMIHFVQLCDVFSNDLPPALQGPFSNARWAVRFDSPPSAAGVISSSRSTVELCNHHGWNGLVCAIAKSHGSKSHVDAAYGEHWDCNLPTGHDGQCMPSRRSFIERVQRTRPEGVAKALLNDYALAYGFASFEAMEQHYLDKLKVTS